jgi:hypothetical protein
MAKQLLITVFLLAAGKVLSQQQHIYELYPTRTSSISYAVQTNNSLDCYSEIRQNGFNYGPLIPAFKAGFYLSNDTTITPADIMIADYTVTCMATTSCGTYPSATYEWLKLISVTGIDLTQLSIPTGTYYVGVYLDREDAIGEFTNGNNGAPLRNLAGQLAIVNYPVLDVGVKQSELESGIEKRYVNNELLIQSRSGSELCVELFSIDGRLIFKERSASVLIPRQGNNLHLLKVSSETGTFIEKCFW